MTQYRITKERREKLHSGIKAREWHKIAMENCRVDMETICQELGFDPDTLRSYFVSTISRSERRLYRVIVAKALRELGYSLNKIAGAMNVSHATVLEWLDDTVYKRHQQKKKENKDAAKSKRCSPRMDARGNRNPAKDEERGEPVQRYRQRVRADKEQYRWKSRGVKKSES